MFSYLCEISEIGKLKPISAVTKPDFEGTTSYYYQLILVAQPYWPSELIRTVRDVSTVCLLERMNESQARNADKCHTSQRVVTDDNGWCTRIILQFQWGNLCWQIDLKIFVFYCMTLTAKAVSSRISLYTGLLEVRCYWIGRYVSGADTKTWRGCQHI